MDNPEVFSQLLDAARAQAQAQRLLFVFTRRELPAGASAQEREQYVQGLGGTLTPMACVDKSPYELSDFGALLQEARAACPPWDVVFVAALAGDGPRPPAPARVDEALKRMVAAVESGHVNSFLALDATGAMLHFH